MKSSGGFLVKIHLSVREEKNEQKPEYRSRCIISYAYGSTSATHRLACFGEWVAARRSGGRALKPSPITCDGVVRWSGGGVAVVVEGRSGAASVVVRSGVDDREESISVARSGGAR